MKISRPSFIILRQLFEKESSTYSYILGCEATKEAVIIDPVRETAKRDATLIEELGLQPLYAINTHVHADHITGTFALREFFPKIKSCVSAVSGGKADILLNDNDVINFGNETLEVRATPGHTDGCVTYVDFTNKNAFTGDALLIRGCGRTDFQKGCSTTLYRSIWKNILTLPEDFNLYVGHNYEGKTLTTVWEEKKWNPRLTKKEDEFVELMKNLKLAYPKQIEKALPANLRDGEPA
ncbi:unnamed protein product [Auanema sp. JU1783]|nr:unnamed protein product [Auanema sp. JU1783]